MTTTLRNPTTEEEAFLDNEEANMNILGANIHKLESDDQHFAQSLYDWWSEKEFLTPRQLKFAMKFFNEIKDLPGVS